jgi:hypothetical protein
VNFTFTNFNNAKSSNKIKKVYDNSNFVNECIVLMVGQEDGRVREMYRNLEGNRFYAWEGHRTGAARLQREAVVEDP